MSENIQVVCRVRPCRGGFPLVTPNMDGCSLTLKAPFGTSDSPANTFGFHQVIRPEQSNLEVYENFKGMPKKVVEGINCAVIAYGQTSSGKTHTMHGYASQGVIGISQLLAQDLFNAIDDAPQDFDFSVEVEYVQVYKERVLDLMDDEASAQINRNGDIACHLQLRDAGGYWFMPKARHRKVHCAADIMHVMQQCERNRRTAVTKMNEFSSRSHSVLIIRVQCENLKKEVRLSSLQVVDLAGSESADRADTSGSTLEEGKLINKSLLALRGVIVSLSEGSRHVPYRDSVLTKLLQNSFGGNSKTALVICVSADELDYRDTLRSCLFGQTSQRVENTIVVNIKKSVPELTSLLAATNEQLMILNEEIKRTEQRIKLACQERGIVTSLPKSVYFDELPKVVPSDLCCQLSGAIFINPVVAKDGVTYEQTFLEQYYNSCGRLPSDTMSRRGSMRSTTPTRTRTTPPPKPGTPPPKPGGGSTLIIRQDVEMEKRVAQYLRIYVSNQGRIKFMKRHGENAPVNENSTFIGLPYDCHLVVFEYLTARDVLSIHRSNQILRTITKGDDIWEAIIVRDFGEECMVQFDVVNHVTLHRFYWYLRKMKEKGDGLPSIVRSVRKGFYLPPTS